MNRRITSLCIAVLACFQCAVTGYSVTLNLNSQTSNLNSQDTLTIAMVGDVMMGTTYPSQMIPANEGKDLFKDAGAILRGADLTLGNLEGTLCDGGRSTKGSGPNSYSFRTPTSFAPRLKEVGFDYMSMANNHANDFGQEGIESTERCLREQGILFSGIEGRIESAVIERGGKKIGLCAFGHNSYTLKHTDLSFKNLAKYSPIVFEFIIIASLFLWSE